MTTPPVRPGVLCSIAFTACTSLRAMKITGSRM